MGFEVLFEVYDYLARFFRFNIWVYGTKQAPDHHSVLLHLHHSHSDNLMQSCNTTTIDANVFIPLNPRVGYCLTLLY